MEYTRFPYFAETLDGMARVKFSNFTEFTILKSTQNKKLDLFNCNIPCSDTRFWRNCPADLDKSFYHEVIDGTRVLEQLFTDIQIKNAKVHFDRILIKTGRVFTI